MGKLPSGVLRRPTLLSSSSASHLSRCSNPLLHQNPSSSISPGSICLLPTNQTRNATFVPRPRRPYHFTQLVQLSDGSTFTVRTTMPTALYKSAKDTRNHILWQPSEKSLKNVELDEAGKLAAFRERFGRGWDIDDSASAGTSAETGSVSERAGKSAEAASGAAEDGKQTEAAAPETTSDQFDSLVDLISSYAMDDPGLKGGKTAKESAKGGKKKK